MTVDPNRIRCIDPLVTPQYPFNEAPKPHVTIRNKATNTIYEGGAKASRLVVPVIPR